MFIRIAGIELKPPQLKRIMKVDGGLHVYCDAIEGIHDESKLKKLPPLKGTTQHVKWEDADGLIQEESATVVDVSVSSRETPDGTKITNYVCTLAWV
ncbi:hypothetical protein D4R47_00125 [archaeon]|nr:MAG: hypothetical protein D4R47_00125 [archaeon]